MANWPAGCDPYWSDQMDVPGKVCLNDLGKFIDIPTGTVAPPSARETTSIAANLMSYIGGGKTTLPGASFDPMKWLGEGYNAIYAALGVVGFVLLLSMAKGGRR